MWVAIVLGWIILSILAGVGAKNKGKNFAGYFFLSLVLSPLVGLIAMAVAKPSEDQSRVIVESREVEMPENEFYSKIAGVTHNNPDGTSRQKLLEFCKDGEELQFIREPENAYDKNAIKICRGSGEQLGYTRSELAADLAPRIDAGEKIRVFVSEITGGEQDTSTRGCNIKIITEPKSTSETPEMTTCNQCGAEKPTGGQCPACGAW